VFDAGSSTDLNAGREVLVPALRRLGVRSIDAIAISHSDIDHYSAVLELADAFRVHRVLVTAHFMEAARADPFGPAAHLLDGLAGRRISTSQYAAGDDLALGRLRLRWLHPRADDHYVRANDRSMVIGVRTPTWTVLLTGDIQEPAIDSLRARHADLTADIIELPHHGRFTEASRALVGQLEPKVVMQSTGQARWARDQWEETLGGIRRLVTARDGACWVEIDENGEITTGRFLDPGR
jgi:competence protein ComEC